MRGLSLEGISHRYDDVVAVDGIDITVHTGEMVCLLGPSGCGKSTVLRLAAGLEQLQRGQISIDGRTVAVGGERRQVPPEARGIGLMFQDYALFPHLTVRENIRFGVAGRTGSRDEWARHQLAELGMAELSERFPHGLSGGQQQRVALLRALAPAPGVMLLDEPFSDLDQHMRHQVREETMALLARSEAATVIVTHDAEEAMFLADRIVVMEQGRIRQDAPPSEIYAHPQDLFTARLFGPVNRYEGVVRAGVVATPLGPVAAPGFDESSQVDVAIRADGVELLPVGEPAAGSVRGRVTSARSLGSVSLVLLSPCSSNTDTRASRADVETERVPAIQVRIPGTTALAVGAELRLRVRPERCFVFPAQPGPRKPAG